MKRHTHDAAAHMNHGLMVAFVSVQPLPSGIIPPDSAVLLGCVLYIMVLIAACMMVGLGTKQPFALMSCALPPK